MSRLDKLTSKEFTRNKEIRALNALRELYGRLVNRMVDHEGTPVDGALYGKTSFPSVLSVEDSVIDTSSIVYVTGDKKVVAVDSAKREVVDLHLLEHKYEGLCAFRIDRIPYVAAGYRNGIVITNVYDDVDEKKIILVDDGKEPISKFKNIGITGRSLEETVLWAAHNDFGILRVPISKLVQGYLRVKRGEEYLLSVGLLPAGKPIKENVPIRLHVFGDEVYVSCGSTVYKFDTKCENFRVLYSIEGDTINALAVNNSVIFSGTVSGKIYRNETVWHDVGNVTTSISKIVPVSADEVLFTTITGGLHGPLRLFNGGEKSIDVSQLPLTSVHDFQIRQNVILTLEGGTVKKYEWKGNDNLELICTMNTTLSKSRRMAVEE